MSIGGLIGWRSSRRLLLGFAATVVVLLGATSPAWSQKLPTGGSVTAGNATIVQPNSTTLNVNQSTNQAIINWNSFSVGHGDTVNFNQPGPSSATLNRVTGSTPSWIAGTINAPGTVLLVNPNGIEITKSGVVNAGSFAASTLGIKDSDFLSGHYSFSGNGGSAGVINKGRINVSDGGFAALLGGQVSNNGVISARLGFVALGAGEQATLDLSGDGFLSVAVPSSELGKLVNGNGALVSNNGKINANGGTVFLSAATAANILRNAVNIPGSIRTNSVGVHDGRIVINGGAGGSVKISGRLAANGGKKHNGGSIAISGQDVSVTGKLTANGKNGGSVNVASSGNLWVSGTTAVRGFAGSGGFVDLTGANITLAAATIDASGTSGGGLARVGGTFQGGNGDPSSALYASFIGRFGALPDIVSAQTVSVDAATRINVSATNSGNAGTAVIWSQQETDFAGSVIGTGGANGGNGGYAEVSSHEILNFTGTVDLLAPGGSTGTLLLDPRNVTISTTGTPQFTCDGGGTCTPTADSSFITPSVLAAALTFSNVFVTTGTTGTTQAGTITVSSAVNWTGTHTLTLSAANTITINAALTGTSGGLSLISSGTGTDGNISEGASGSISVAALAVSTAGTVTLNSASNNVGTLAASTGTLNFTDSSALTIGLGGITATGNVTLSATGTISDPTAPVSVSGIFTLAGGNWLQNQSTLPSFFAHDFRISGGSFLRAVGGTGSSSSPYLIADIYGLQGIGTLISNTAATNSFALANDIDASGTASWNAGAGFAPINVGLTNQLFIFNGQNNAIFGLTINRSGSTNVGLFGQVSASSSANALIENVGLVGGSITGGSDVGALIGQGDNNLTVANSYSSANVTGSITGIFTGGLIGLYSTPGSISLSNIFATGSVTGGDQTGGLIGTLVGTGGTLKDAYATGNVSGTIAVGGLIGFFGVAVGNGNFTTAAIDQVYANGNVSGTSSVQALIGVAHSNSITNAYTGLSANNTGLPAGFDDFAWGTMPGVTTPYLLFQPGVISGFATQSDRTTPVAAGTTVNLTLNGVAQAPSQTVGPNGAYSFYLGGDTAPGERAIPTNSQLFVATSGGVTYVQNAFNNVKNAPVYNSYFGEISPATTLSALNTGYASAISGLSSLQSQINALPNRALFPTGASFTIDTTIGTGVLAIAPPNTNIALGSGSGVVISQSALNNITASTLVLGGTTIEGGQFPYNPTVTVGGSVTLPSHITNLTLASGSSDTIGSGVTLLDPNANGTITLQANALTFGSTTTSLVQETGANGTVAILPASSAIPILGTVETMGLGTGTGAKFVLSQTELNEITTTTLIFGSAGITTTITVGGSVSVPNTIGNLSLVTGNALTVSSGAALTDSNTNATVTLQGSSISLVGSVAVTGTNATLILDTTGTATQSGGAISATKLLLLGAGGSYTLTGANSVGTLAANTGSVGFTDSTNLSIGSVGGTNGITATTLALSDSGGSISQTQAISASGTSSFTTSASNATIALNQTNLLTGAVSLNTGTGGNANLTNGQATTLGTSTVGGSLTLTSGGDLSISGAVATGAATLAVTGNVTIASGGRLTAAANGNIVLSATGNFINNQGSNAVSVSGTGRWLIYSNAPASDTFGNLNSNNTAIWDATLATLPPASVAASGDSYIFAYQPTLTFTSTGVLTKTYGQDAAAAVAASSYTVTGLQPGVTGVFLGDMAANVYSGTPTLSSTGAGVLANASATPYGITINVNALTALNGYAFATVNNGTLTVNSALLTLNGAKIYDSTTAFAASTFGTGGTISTGTNGETLMVTGSGSVVSANVSAGTQTLTQGSLALTNGTGLASNYQIAKSGNTGAITAATLTLNGTKTYDSTIAFAASTFGVGGTISTGINGETLIVTGSGSVASANVSAGTQTLTQGSLALTNGTGLASNYQIAKSGNTGTISAATLTLNGSKTYDSTTAFAASTFVTGGTLSTGINGETLIVTGSGSVASANVSAGTQTLTQGSLALTNGTGLASNYQIAKSGNTGTVTAATLTLNGSKTYDSTTTFAASAFNGGTINTGINGETLIVTGSGSVASANVSAGTQTLTQGSLALADGTGLASNYQIAKSGNTGTITAATLTLNGTKTYDSTTAFGASTFGSGGTINTGINGETLAVAGLGSVASSNVSAGTQTLAQGSLALANGTGLASNYQIAKSGNTGTTSAATLTLNGSKTYDSTTAIAASTFGTGGIISTGINGETLAVSGLGSVASSNVIAGTQGLSLGSLALANNTGLASNYQIAKSGNTGAITAATLTLNGTKTYDSTTAFAASAFGSSGTLSTGINGQTLVLTGSGSVGSANVSAGTQTLTLGSLALTNGAGLASNYQIGSSGNAGTITPAALTYVANANSMKFGGSVPSLSGTVTGFVGHETLASATTGTLAFNTPATSLSPAGSYAITGSGLTANHGNYTFVQQASNATALTIASQSASPTSQFLAAVNGNTPNNNVSINFQNTGTPALVHIAFTPNSPTTTAANQKNNDASPAALPPGAAFTRNQGLDFQPISQYDANQYSQFKLPDYDDKDGEATVFTIIARAVAHDHAADFMIDGFWNGTANDWHGANANNPLTGKVTYSDGAGHDVVPADSNAFPILPGKTDFARLLKNGPVMLGGVPGQAPAEWLLALNLAPDGKGIVCDDPITGKLVEIAYDQTTETLGSVTGIFDPKIKGFGALADAGGEIPAAAAAAVAALQGFMPSTFFAVTIH